MTCCNIKENLHSYIDNELDTSIASTFRKHLDICPQCLQEYSSLTQLLSLIKTSDIPPVADEEWKKIHDSVLSSISNLPVQQNVAAFPYIFQNIINFSSIRTVAALFILTLVSFGVILLSRGEFSVAYPKIVAIDGNAFSSDAVTDQVSSVHPAEQNLALPPGRAIRTDGHSTLQIQVDKSSTIRLGNNSHFSVSDCAAKKAVFKLKSGDLAAQVSKRKPDQLFRIETPNAFCEVVGTRFNVTTHHDQFRDRYITTLVVLEGTVQFGSNEKHIPVKAGHAIAIFGDSLGSLTSSDDPHFNHLLQKPSEGLFTIATNPSNALIIIDGKEIGTTPFAGSLPFGKHTVICKKEGFAEWTGSLIIDSYSESLLDIRLSVFSPALKSSVKLSGNTLLDHPTLKNAHELLLSGQYEKALDLLKQMAENVVLSPELRATALNKMSMCHKYAGDYTSSVSVLSRIINGNFPSVQQGNALFERGTIYLHNLEKTTEAFNDFQHYTENFSNGLWIKEARLSFADLLYRRGDFTGAAEAYRTFCETYKGSSQCENALFALGMIYTNNLSDFNRAIASFNRLQLEYPESKSLENALFWSADCLLRQGLTNRAITSFENYSHRYPHGKWHSEVAARLKKIETAGAR